MTEKDRQISINEFRHVWTDALVKDWSKAIDIAKFLADKNCEICYGTGSTFEYIRGSQIRSQNEWAPCNCVTKKIV